MMDTEMSPAEPYWFGKGSREARAAAAAIVGTEESVLPGVLPVALRCPSLRSRVLAALLARKLSSSGATEAAAALGAPTDWTNDEAFRVACWLSDLGSPAWPAWIAPVLAAPPSAARSHALGFDILLRQRAEIPTLPAAVTCADAVVRDPSILSATERFAWTRRRLDQKLSEPGAVEALIVSAHAANLPSTVAVLLELWPAGARPGPPVIAAYHALDWRRYGSTKQAFAAGVAETVDDPRLVALRQWARGSPQEALTTFGRLLTGDEIDPVLAREYLVCWIAAGRSPRDRGVTRMIEALRKLPEHSWTARWFEVVLQLLAPGYHDPERVLAATTELPASTDPLFAPIATLLQRTFFADPRFEAAWATLSARLDAVDPLWRARVPYPECDYVRIMQAILSAPLAGPELTVLLRQVLLLPVDHRWVRRVLEFVLRNEASLVCADDDGGLSPFGLALFDIVIRVVEYVELAGHLLDPAVVADLTAPDPHPMQLARIVDGVLQSTLHAKAPP